MSAAIPGHPTLSWGDAVRLFLPDAHGGQDGAIEATKIAKARRLDSTDEVGSDATFHVTWLSARDVVEGGRPRLLILAEVDESLSGTPGSALLALIEPGQHPRLLDLVDIGDDRENYLDTASQLKIGPGSDLVMVSSTHLNAGEEYSIRQALFVDHDRFGLLAAVPLLSLKLCGYERVQTAEFAVPSRPGAQFGMLQIAVTEQARRIAEVCDPPTRLKVGTKTWRARFSWNPTARTFQTTSRALEELSEHNASEVQ